MILATTARSQGWAEFAIGEVVCHVRERSKDRVPDYAESCPAGTTPEIIEGRSGGPTGSTADARVGSG